MWGTVREIGVIGATVGAALLTSLQPAHAGIGTGHVISGFALGVIVGGLAVYWHLRGRGGR